MYVCNCAHKDKYYKYQYVSATKDGLCPRCGHYAIQVPESQELEFINDLLFSKEITKAKKLRIAINSKQQ